MKDLDFLTSNLIAHRGFHDSVKKIPENSISSFKRAVRYGYIIELDVHLLKDGNIVVFHDDNLKRMCGVNKDINDLTYDEIKDLKLLDTKEKIPLLTDVLNLVNGKVPILIETKYYKKYGVLEKKLINLLKKYNGLYAIQSFYPKSILWLKNNYKEIPRGQLATCLSNENFLTRIVCMRMLTNIFTKPDFVSYNIKFMPNKYTNKAKKKKMLLGWTVKTKKEYEKNKNYCDNLICENMKLFDNFIDNKK